MAKNPVDRPVFAWKTLIAALVTALLMSPALRAETLQHFAQQCDIETGVSVPAFDCDDPNATEVPMTHAHFNTPGNPSSGVATCDRPNRLNQVCDPGSRFHVLVRKPDSFVVAHCRKKGGQPGLYGDIAVIQHNSTTGATCFYQEGPSPGVSALSHNVVAPSVEQGEWLTPDGIKGERCAGCHDNGPIIRSPYLSQITGPNKLPGAGDSLFNSVSHPYYFVGDTFADWKAFRVTAPVTNPVTHQSVDNTCNGCHRMGVNNVGDGGTALDFGIRATRNAPEASQNPHSAESPLWMLLGETSFDAGHAAHADAIRACAQRFRANPTGQPPNDATCRVQQYTGVPDSADHYAAIWTKANLAPFIARHGLTAAEYQAEFDKHGPDGFRLTAVSGYEVGGQPHFAAIWRKQPGGALLARHGLTAAQYQVEFTKNAAAGFTLAWVDGYTVGGQDFYAAIWEKRTNPPAWIARHGLNAAQYQAAFDTNLRNGFRLESVSGYAVGNEARYAAIWRKVRSPPWAARHGLTGQQYQDAFDQMAAQGFHLVLVSGYKVGPQTLFAGIWEKSPTGALVARHGLPNAIYQEEFDALVGQGFTLADVSGY